MSKGKVTRKAGELDHSVEHVSEKKKTNKFERYRQAVSNSTGTRGGSVDVKMIVSAFRYEQAGVVERLFLDYRIRVLLGGHDQNVFQPDAFMVRFLKTFNTRTSIIFDGKRVFNASAIDTIICRKMMVIDKHITFKVSKKLSVN